MQGAVIDKLVEHPLYLERELGLLHGNVMHLEMSIDQMFMLRPALTMANYRGPLKGLYLTGASLIPAAASWVQPGATQHPLYCKTCLAAAYRTSQPI